MTEKLGLEIQGPIYQALSQESIYTLSDLVTLQDKDIEDLQYTMTLDMEDGQLTSTTLLLSCGNKGWIRALIAFVKHHQLQSEDKFEDTSIEEFNKFRLNSYNTEAYLRPLNSPNYHRGNSKPKTEGQCIHFIPKVNQK